MTKEEIIEQVTNSAFPQSIRHNDIIIYGTGLTKREIFAAMTMQAILSKPVVDSIKQAAKESVIAADALIKALNETEIE